MNQIKTLFVVSLLLLSACIPCVAAVGNDERPRAPDMQADKTIRQAPDADARAGPDGMSGVAAEVRRAREIYRQDQTPENLEKLKAAEKKHFTLVIDGMVERLVILQKRIKVAEAENILVPEGASDNIDRYILRLESYKSEVRAADTPEDIKSVARSIDMEWKSIRKEIMHYTKFMIAVRIDAYIEKANNISDRLDERIGDLGGKDVDTTNMILNLDEFKEKLACVEENYELAENAVSDDEINPGEVKQYIQNASICIREANNCLGKVFREMRTLGEYDIEEVSDSGDDESADEDLADEDSADEAANDTTTNETVNETTTNETVNETTTNETVNESDSGTDDEADGDAGTSGNETESETDDGDSSNETTTNETVDESDSEAGEVDDEDADTSGNETGEATS